MFERRIGKEFLISDKKETNCRENFFFKPDKRVKQGLLRFLTTKKKLHLFKISGVFKDFFKQKMVLIFSD